MKHRYLKPGAMFYRDTDRKWGLVIGMQEPLWAQDGLVLEGYRFLLLIDNVLIETNFFTSQFTLVQGETL